MGRLMYLVYVILSALVILMAMHGRRKYRRYIKGRIDFELALGTLTGNNVLGGLETNVLTETAFLTSVKATWALKDLDPQPSDGPIWVGLAHSDYTDAEVEEWIEEGASWDAGDMVATREINRRLIRQVGVFQNVSSATGTEVLNDGRPITTKCRWGLTTGQTVRFWVYNSGNGALVSGAILHVNGHANLWPN